MEFPSEVNFDEVVYYQPNFVALGALPFDYDPGSGYNKGSFTLTEYWVSYEDNSYHTGIRDIGFYPDMYGYHLEGTNYRKEKEVPYLPYQSQFTFSLAVIRITRKIKREGVPRKRYTLLGFIFSFNTILRHKSQCQNAEILI